MALQVWCPLIKDIHNQGISNIMPSASGATFTTSGKIGSGALNSSNEFSVTIPALSGKKVWSFCFWGYVVSSTITSDWTQIARINDGSSNFRVEVCPKTTSNGIYCYSTHNNSGNAISNGSISSPNGGYYDQWAHFCLTSDGTTIFKYMNGELIGTCSYNGAGAITGTFVLANNNRIYKNDLRVYDHCLSICELKAISSALVLHYPLNDAYLQSTTNLNKSIGTSWGYWGTNTVTSNSFTSPEGTQGSHVICSSLTSGGVCVDHSSFSVKPNTTYVISAKMKLTGSTDYNLFYWREYDSSNTQLSASGKWSSTRAIEYGHGYKLYYGVVTTSSATNSVRLQSYFYGVGEHWIYDIQVEEGDYPTPFAGYNASRNETTVHDCSGYQNNGTASESLPYALNSPRYKGCYYFNTTSKRITLPTINMTGFADTFSISWWGNAPSYSNGIMYWGFSNGNHLNYYCGQYCNTNDGSGNPYYVPNTTTTIATPSINEWHHFVMVGDGSTNKLYMDGELYGIAKTYKGITGNTIVINGYDSSVNYKTNGYISDFRIYSTALSADDVKELYNTSCIINS